MKRREGWTPEGNKNISGKGSNCDVIPGIRLAFLPQTTIKLDKGYERPFLGTGQQAGLDSDRWEKGN